jgi:diguanylate cyclase (GGDEF)-like protein
MAQIDVTSVFVLGSLLMACGGGGLVVVRLSNPRLRGLNWLGGTFASGCMGALLLALFDQLPRFFSIVLSDLFVLLSFVLLHVAILDLRRATTLWPKLGLTLVAIQFTACYWLTFVNYHPKIRMAIFCLTLALQLAQTVLQLVRGARRGTRLPSWFMAAILSFLIAASLSRIATIWFLRSDRRSGPNSSLQTLFDIVFVCVAMGIAFGFFWMTTAELSDELELMASTDPLTRIYNRRVFREHCEREHDRSRRTGAPFSLLMMDLDHFKRINDRYGHRGGDELLLAVVQTMQDSIRGIDTLGRWGGEEFVALLPGTRMDSALIVAQRVRRNVEQLILSTPEGPMRATVSLGVATLRGSEDGLDAVFVRADQALYLAKEAGRNQVLTVP